MLSGREFAQYRQNNPVNTTVGAVLAVTLPLGEYNRDWLINLGGNRYVLPPQIGVLHQRRKWQFEMTGSVFLFQDNDEFWQGTRFEQDPLWFIQGHLIQGFKPGWWVSLSGGYAYGGRLTSTGWRKIMMHGPATSQAIRTFGRVPTPMGWRRPGPSTGRTEAQRRVRILLAMCIFGWSGTAESHRMQRLSPDRMTISNHGFRPRPDPR